MLLDWVVHDENLSARERLVAHVVIYHARSDSDHARGPGGFADGSNRFDICRAISLRMPCPSESSRPFTA